MTGVGITAVKCLARGRMRRVPGDMTGDRIVAVGLLTQANLDLLGPTLTRVWPVEETPCFSGLLQAIDQRIVSYAALELRTTTVACDTAAQKVPVPNAMATFEPKLTLAQRHRGLIRLHSSSSKELFGGVHPRSSSGWDGLRQ